MTWQEYLLVFFWGVVSGGSTPAAGRLPELEHFAVYLATLAGLLSWSPVLVRLPGHIHSSLLADHFSDAEKRVPSSTAAQPTVVCAAALG